MKYLWKYLWNLTGCQWVVVKFLITQPNVDRFNVFRCVLKVFLRSTFLPNRSVMIGYEIWKVSDHNWQSSHNWSCSVHFLVTLTRLLNTKYTSYFFLLYNIIHVLLYGIVSIPWYVDTVTGKVLQVTGVVWWKVTCRVTHVTLF